MPPKKKPQTRQSERKPEKKSDKKSGNKKPKGRFCGITTGLYVVETPAGQPVKVLRNGMDCESDASNETTVRDWQMSPFSNERFDLDELQRAKNRGFKGRAEFERLKKLYPYIEIVDDDAPSTSNENCEEEEKKPEEEEEKCSWEYLYQPYGPSVVSSLSYSHPDANKPRLYTYLGPSYYSQYRFKPPGPNTNTVIPCQDRQEFPVNTTQGYVPYGPLWEYRFTPDMYVPMGPPVYRVNK